MIYFASERIRAFIRFISREDIPPVDLFVVPGYDALEINDAIHDKTYAFGAYDPDNARIIVPEGITEKDKELVLSTIAHEYFHHIEKATGAEHNEENAEKYAAEKIEQWKIVEDFLKKE